MRQINGSGPKLALVAGGLVLSGGLAAPAVLADSAVRWRLHAVIPVQCAILDIAPAPAEGAALTVRTQCNARAYRLLLHEGAVAAEVVAAHSSAGKAEVNGGAVTILAARPGEALATIYLAAPIAADKLSVTLQPL